MYATMSSDEADEYCHPFGPLQCQYMAPNEAKYMVNARAIGFRNLAMVAEAKSSSARR